MNVMSTKIRKSAGQPAGGEFSTPGRPEADVTLMTDDTLTPTTSQPKRGQWTVYDPTIVAEESFGPYTVKSVSADDDTEAVRNAKAAAIHLADSVMALELAHELARAGERMTILTIGDNGVVRAVEGVGRHVNGEPVLIRKDSSTEGWRIWSMNIIDCEPGYSGKNVLAARFGDALREITGKGFPPRTAAP